LCTCRRVCAAAPLGLRAAKLTGQLLAFARRQALEPDTFDAGASLDEVASIVRTLTGSRIFLNIVTPDEPCFVLADRGQFDTAIIRRYRSHLRAAFHDQGSGEGTGLGLSQVIGFAKQSNGDIRAESVSSEGTTFTLYLPRVSVDAFVEEEASKPEAQVNSDGICVLVVEDNKGVGEFAVQALSELGYHTILAMNADEPLAKLERDCDRFASSLPTWCCPG